MRFVMFFGTIAAFAGLWVVLQYIPENIVLLVAGTVYGGGAAIAILWLFWRLCRAAYPPKGRQP